MCDHQTTGDYTLLTVDLIMLMQTLKGNWVGRIGYCGRARNAYVISLVKFARLNLF